MKDTNITGAISETKILLWCIENNIAVSFPYGDKERYDQIWDVNGRLLKIQIKTARPLDEKREVIEFNCYSISNGKRKVYSKEEIDSAIEIIKKQFASFEGCELHSLSYMPDEECNNADNIEWMNDLRTDDNKEAFTQCIAFESSFRSPKKGGGAWEANEEYTWSWWLARSEGGEWNLMTWGY